MQRPSRLPAAPVQPDPVRRGWPDRLDRIVASFGIRGCTRVDEGQGLVVLAKRGITVDHVADAGAVQRIPLDHPADHLMRFGGPAQRLQGIMQPVAGIDQARDSWPGPCRRASMASSDAQLAWTRGRARGRPRPSASSGSSCQRLVQVKLALGQRLRQWDVAVRSGTFREQQGGNAALGIGRCIVRVDAQWPGPAIRPPTRWSGRCARTCAAWPAGKGHRPRSRCGWPSPPSVLPRQQCGLQLLQDGGGDFVLDGEHVVQFAVVGFRPQVEAVVDLDQLGGDAHLCCRICAPSLRGCAPRPGFRRSGAGPGSGP